MDEQKLVKKYAFEGRVIKLNEADYNKWCEVYWAIPDMRSALYTLDGYYASEIEMSSPGAAEIPKTWFRRTSSVLLKRHEYYIRLDEKLKKSGKIMEDPSKEWNTV